MSPEQPTTNYTLGGYRPPQNHVQANTLSSTASATIARPMQQANITHTASINKVSINLILM